jgi:hypothetical protein
MQIKVYQKFSPSLGHYMTAVHEELKGDQGRIPDICINVVPKGKNVQFTTMELVRANTLSALDFRVRALSFPLLVTDSAQHAYQNLPRRNISSIQWVRHPMP